MCDRTQDFQSVLQQISVTTGNKNIFNKPKASSSSSGGSNGKDGFYESASDIAKGVHKTSTMLQKLTTLVRKQGLFDDPTDEINTLIYRIKQDLDELNSKCDNAQQVIDTKKSSSFLFDSSSSSQSSQHNIKVVSHLKSDLMNTTKTFKTVLELRSNKMKDQQQRKVELIGNGLLSPTKYIEHGNAGKSSAPQAVVSSSSGAGGNSFLDNSANLTATGGVLTKRGAAGNKKGGLPLNPYQALNGNSNAVGKRNASADLEDGSNDLSNNNAFDNKQLETQHLLLEPISADNQYYDAREQAVNEVEKTIGELGQLFKRLATMIQAQQELVERIDDDVETAVSNTDNAKNALMKAYESVSSNRGIYMKIGGILVVFILVFILFLL